LVLLSSETGISAGVRRIECWSGAGALERVLSERGEREQIAALLRSDTQDLPAKVDRLMAQSKSLEKELETAKAKLAHAASGQLAQNARLSPKGIKVITETVEGADTDTLRAMVDRLRLKIGSGVVALGTRQGERAVIVAGVTPDLTATVNAGQLVKEASKLSGGKGGGRADFAQAGGVDAELLGQTLDKLFALVA
jgi:alanyl-tRNA synthetase